MNPTATQMISGCGPGTAVPAGTKQEGVRGERVDRAAIELRIFKLETEMDLMMFHANWTNADLARMHQQLADAYNALARMEGKG